MSDAHRFDAIVIGGGIGGLIAACYLAKGGACTLVLEARENFGGCASPGLSEDGTAAPPPANLLYALDPIAAIDLNLEGRGLSYAVRQMRTIALRTDREPIHLPVRDFFRKDAAGTLEASDAVAFLRFHKAICDSARRLRPVWSAPVLGVNETPFPSVASIAQGLQFSNRDTDLFIQMSRLGAASFLDRFIENDALKAALSFDACENGLSPGDPGSALLLHWRYAQESARVQGAVSQPRSGRGALPETLVRAAGEFGVALRGKARVKEILMEHDHVSGVLLEDGEVLRASVILSNLDTRATLFGLLPPGAFGFAAAARVPEPRKFGDAKVTFTLDGLPPFVGLDISQTQNRLIAAERPEAADEAKAATFANELPSDLVMEITVPTAADSELLSGGQHLLDVRIPFVSLRTERAHLIKRVTSCLERYAPGLKERIVSASAVTPADITLRYGGTPGGLNDPYTHLIASYTARITTPVKGLFLCGSSAEPVTAISGRAGRVAASFALEHIENARRGAS